MYVHDWELKKDVVFQQRTKNIYKKGDNMQRRNLLNGSAVVFIVMILLCSCTGIDSGTDIVDSPINANQWVEEYESAYAARDIDTLLTFYADDCTMEDVAMGNVANGKEEIRAGFQMVHSVMPNMTREITSSFGTGAYLCVEWSVKGDYTGNIDGTQITDKNVAHRGVTVYELRDGKIIRESNYYDLNSFLRKLGISLKTNTQ
jgi:steroid delta-isomerase-like uncharacterized protein